MKKTIPLLIIALLTGFVYGAEKPEYKSNIDYIQKTGRLWGIAEVKINDDNSITLIDAESGYGSGLMMSLSKVQKSATLEVGQSCSLSDGHHAFIEYNFTKLKDGKITFFITDKFDARSFGDGIKKETKTATITPYTKETKSQQKNSHVALAQEGFVPGEIIINFRDSVDGPEAVRIMNALNLKIKKTAFAQYRYVCYFQTAPGRNVSIKGRLEMSQLFTMVDIPLDKKGVDLSTDTLFAYPNLKSTKKDVSRLIGSLRGVSLKSFEATPITLLAAVQVGQERSTITKVIKHKRIKSAGLNIVTSLDNALQKVEIDLSVLDTNGLRGPSDGKVSVAYEFCIPNTDKCKGEVRAIDRTVKFSPGSRGRIGSSKDQCLCIGHTRKDFRKVLQLLANLSYVERIIECHFE